MVLALIGYLIVVNEEIHTSEVRLADSYLEFQKFSENDKKIYMDVLGNANEKIGYNEARAAFIMECTDRLDGASTAVLGSTGNASVVNNYYNNDNSRTVNAVSNLIYWQGNSERGENKTTIEFIKNTAKR